MRKTFQAAYVPIGVGTFHLESAQKLFDSSAVLLREIDPDFRVPEQMLLSIDLLDDYLEGLDPDLIVLQNITFANAAYASEVLRRFTCPILLWTLREPVIDGGRLRLNSLTGAFSAGNAIRAFRSEPFEYVFGAPDEEDVKKKVRSTYKAALLKHSMKSLKIAQIGHTPQGFGFGRAMDLEMMKTFGATLESIEARELIDRAKGYSDEDIAEYLEDASKRTRGMENMPQERQADFARLYRAYKEYAADNNIGALASRCWPDFFTAFGTPVCTVLGILNDLGVAASCETDAYGALSMYAGMQLSGRPVFFGDPVSLDEAEHTITFWHCGTAACSLAREDTGAGIGEHCNRHIGPTLEFGTKASDHATIFRIGKKPDGSFRVLIISGKALDKPKQFFGTSTVIETEAEPKKVITDCVRDGWEPHFAVAYEDIADELEAFADMLGLEVVRF